MEHVKIGDEVRIANRRHIRGIAAQRYDGIVIKVGRKYAIAEYEVIGKNMDGGERRTTRAVEFDMTTGIERGASSNYGYYVRTPEQADRDDRRSAALAVLAAGGIEFRLGAERKFTLEQIEALAELVETFGSEAGQ
jgi:hypothetical protein